ncbi:DUF2628 domain-containing protein [Gottfriedia sp. NPDC056225]|uniref:DUF2628 domain-containing protein n=1 Tax=Gottfriedia sp. NPDC056225 TaxID=3345751 RepID=UPI0035D6FA89
MCPSDYDERFNAQKSLEHRLEEYEKVVKTNQSYYGFKWGQVSDPTKKNTWNWAAFFFTLHWFAYRKMYKPFILLGFIVTVWIVSFLIFDLSVRMKIILYLVVPLGISFVLGWQGNRLYYHHVGKILKRSKKMSEKRREYYIQNKGGTHVGMLVGLISLLIISDVVIGTLATYIPTKYNITTSVAGTSEGFNLEDYTNNPNWKVLEKKDGYYVVEFKGFDYSYHENVRILFRVYFYKDVYDWEKVYLNGKLLNDQEMEDYENYING